MFSFERKANTIRDTPIMQLYKIHNNIDFISKFNKTMFIIKQIKITVIDSLKDIRRVFISV